MSKGKCGVILLFLLVIAGAWRWYVVASGDFRIANITHEMPYRSEWAAPPLNVLDKQKIQKILDQEFRFLGKGSQSYAFASEDGQYVLKFFKFKHLRPSLLDRMILPVPPFDTWRKERFAEKQKNLERVFNGYRLSFDALKTESGLVYIHLNQTKDLKKKVRIQDKLGMWWKIDLDPTIFVIQKRAETTKSVMRKLIEEGKITEAKSRLKSALGMYTMIHRKGIFNGDRAILTNTGFIGDLAIHVDVGKFAKDARFYDYSTSAAERQRLLDRARKWIHKEYPQHEEALIAGL